jgi:hypothetical protein
MKIREGAYYRTRGGDVVGPMRHGEPGSHFPWITLTRCWTIGGQVFRELKGAENCMDLISEVYVSDTSPVVKDTEAQLREMMRDPRYWRTREPEFIKRVTEGFRALVGGDTPPVLANIRVGGGGGEAPAPEVKTLRDEFAMEAMKLLIPRQEYKDETFAELAYIQADAMMEARKK